MQIREVRAQHPVGLYQPIQYPFCYSDIYEVCHRSSAQGNRLLEVLSPRKSVWRDGFIYRNEESPLGDIPDCPQDTGMIKYWNLNKIPFKVNNTNKTWTVCAHLNYSVSMRGSILEYQNILNNGAVKVWLFSGDFDDVVPFTDTEKNLQILNRQKAGGWSSWSVGDQHGGFYQVYGSNLTAITVKGAGHMVPQTQPKAVYQLFYNFINNKGPNNQIF
jgi:pimeloyl-ACP methyl ester carboxylesterase